MVIFLIFVQIHIKQPTFGQKHHHFYPNLYKTTHIWTKIDFSHLRVTNNLLIFVA